MTFGIYKHYKGGWYLGLWKVWESSNNQLRREKVFYFSFGKRTFNVRDASEFYSEVKVLEGSENHYHYEFRFKKLKLFGEPCYCRELGAYETCPAHGRPQYGNHKVLKRFDGHEHERPACEVINCEHNGGHLKHTHEKV